MKVLIVGGGGREHVLAWKLAQSPRVSEVIAAPGNAGIASLGRCFAGVETPDELLDLARREGADLTVIGPEAPLVAGVVDLFEANGMRVFGPRAAAARLEGSKSFAKDFMARHGIPTANYRCFTDVPTALAYLKGRQAPIVVKDSRLAAGKGVTIAATAGEAEAAVRAILEAPGGGELVIEEFMAGQELSLLVLCDGLSARPMPIAQDYKQAGDGDTGPMTGGMGAVAPAPLLSQDDLAGVMRTIVNPTLNGLRQEGMPYRGVLFIGLMVTAAGIRVLEYNVRFGDPEAQVVLPLLKTDLLEVIEAVIEGRLAGLDLAWASSYAACVVMAAPGYPGDYRKGVPVTIPRLPESVVVFHAGTHRSAEGLVSSGGRVLGVTGLAERLPEAIDAAYQAVERINFTRAHYRRDIGGRLEPRKS